MTTKFSASSASASHANVWVIGSGGLLGTAVMRQFATAKVSVFTAPVGWRSPDALQQLCTAMQHFFSQVSPAEPWQILWCAGSGVTGTPKDQLDAEVAVFKGFLAFLGRVLEQRAPESRLGHFYYTSSVGGVYSGSENPPFTEFTPPVPIAPYGWAKLQCENAVADFTATTGTPSFIGRISTLYGPGQNLAKPQGLVSVLIKNYLMREPTFIYVPLDTMRDYIFVDDAAAIITTALNAMARHRASAPRCLTKIIAAQRADTIGALIAACQMAFKVRPAIILGASPLAAHQIPDLRVRSVVWPELDHRSLTSLPVGISATLRDMRLMLQRRGGLRQHISR